MGWIDRLEKNQKQDPSRVHPLQDEMSDSFFSQSENEKVKENIIYILYHYEYNPLMMGEQESIQGAYLITKIFIDSALLDLKDLNTVYDQMFLDQRGVNLGGGIGPFEGINQINHYLVEIIGKFSLDAAYLISTQDFNLGMASITDKSEFFSIFQSFGRRIESSEPARSKSSWFRLF